MKSANAGQLPVNFPSNNKLAKVYYVKDLKEKDLPPEFNDKFNILLKNIIYL